MRKTKILAFLKFLFAAILVAGFVYGYGRLIGVWQGYPKGTDVPMHITRIKYWLDFFPHIFWNYQWANGMPFIGTYGPLFHILGAILVKVGLTYEMSLFALYFFSIWLLGFAIWGLVNQLSKNFWMAISASFLALSAFRVWYTVVKGGVYSRFFAIALWILTIWLVVRLIEKVREGRKRKEDIVLVTIFLSLTMLSHVLMAAFCWLMIFLTIFFTKLSSEKRISLVVKLLGVSFVLTSFFYFPLLIRFFLGGGAGRFFGGDTNLKMVPLSMAVDLIGIGLFVFPCLLLSIVLARKIRERYLAFPSLVMFMIFFFYTYVSHLGFPNKFYLINGFIPYSGLPMMAIFGAIAIGIYLGLFLNQLERKGKFLAPILFLLFCGGIGISSFLTSQELKKPRNLDLVYEVITEGRAEERSQKILKFPDEDSMHRFMPADAFESVWFNSLYKIPQEKDYYAQGVLFPDWRFWLEQALWNYEEFSLNEAKMGIDWFALRWFAVTKNPWIAGNRRITIEEDNLRYLKNPDFRLVTYGDNTGLGAKMAELRLYQFEVAEPTPILSATNTPMALFIGKIRDYRTFVRDLALLNINSQRLIPLYGGEKLASFSQEDLERYDLIVLYKTNLGSNYRLANRLKEYVEKGGHLFWEGREGEGFLEPSPVKAVETQSIKGDWGFEKRVDSLTEGVDFNQFSSAIYEGDVWKVEMGKELYPWARPLVLIDNQPVIVRGKLGKGEVIWSGINFFFHLITNKDNQQEVKFFQNLANWAVTEKVPKKTSFNSQFINPEKRKVEISSSARAVIFRESFYPNWKAYLVKEKRKQGLKVYQAGPGLMAVVLPIDFSPPGEVIFAYRLLWFEKLGFLIWLMAICLFVIYILEGTVVKRGTAIRLLGPLAALGRAGETISGWWEKEEGES